MDRVKLSYHFITFANNMGPGASRVTRRLRWPHDICLRVYYFRVCHCLIYSNFISPFGTERVGSDRI